MRKAGHIIFLVCPNLFAVDASLRASDSGACIVRIPKPDEKARQERWQYWVKEQGIKHDEGCDETVLGRITNGLSIRQIDEICQAAQVRGQLLSLSLIKTKKQEILNNEIGDKVKITIPTQGFDALGGKDELKAYLMEIKGNILSGNSRRVPVGLLASGPPGTSKTYTFQCWAYECDVVFVEIQNPRDMYVGQSEERMLEIFAILEDLAPVIVVEDEADQSESSRGSYSGDSGVSNRLRQMKFTFCSDPKHRGKIIWVRISNRDDLLDAAYKRKGRTDDKIPFLLPEEEDYKAIFAVMFRRDKISTDITDFSALSKKVAAKTYCTGADIEWMVGEADKYAGREGAEKVTEKHLDQAIDDWEMDMNPRDVDRQIVLAIKGSSKRLRPKNWEQMLAAVNKRMDGTA